MFCPECGSTDKEMVGDVCIDCFLKEFQMIDIPKRIEVQFRKELKFRYAATATANSKKENGATNSFQKMKSFTVHLRETLKSPMKWKMK